MIHSICSIDNSGGRGAQTWDEERHGGTDRPEVCSSKDQGLISGRSKIEIEWSRAPHSAFLRGVYKRRSFRGVHLVLPVGRGEASVMPAPRLHKRQNQRLVSRPKPGA